MIGQLRLTVRCMIRWCFQFVEVEAYQQRSGFMLHCIGYCCLYTFCGSCFLPCLLAGYNRCRFRQVGDLCIAIVVTRTIGLGLCQCTDVLFLWWC